MSNANYMEDKSYINAPHNGYSYGHYNHNHVYECRKEDMDEEYGKSVDREAKSAYKLASKTMSDSKFTKGALVGGLVAVGLFGVCKFIFSTSVSINTAKTST